MFLLIFLLVIGYILWSIYFYIVYRPRSVTGDTVLITGGGSGLGRLMALDFAKRGANVILWDINQKGLVQVQLELEAIKQCPSVKVYNVDVSKRSEVYCFARMVGHVDILINNAGIVSGKPILECPDEMIEKTFQVNVHAQFWTIKAFLPSMLKKNKGHIVSIASASGLYGVPGLVDYSASKFACVGIMESLYLELRRNTKIKTTCISPFFIDTGMFDGVRNSRVPFLLSVLEPNATAARIMKAILRGEEHITIPNLVWMMLPLKVLPNPILALVVRLFGLDSSMDDFVGRSGGTRISANGKRGGTAAVTATTSSRKDASENDTKKKS